MRIKLLIGFISVFLLLSVISAFITLNIAKEQAVVLLSLISGFFIMIIGFGTDRLFTEYISEYNLTRNELEKAKHKAEVGQEELKKRDVQNNSLIELISIINRVKKQELLFKNIINYLCKASKAHIGIIYFVDEEKKIMKFAGSFPEKIKGKSFKNLPFGKGRCGQVLIDKKLHVFVKQPDDYLKIETSLVKKQAQNILIFPVTDKEKVLALIEIGSFEQFSEMQKEFFEVANNSIANSITLSLSKDEISNLIHNTQNQSFELEKQAKQLEKVKQEADNARNKAENKSNTKLEFFLHMSHIIRTPIDKILERANKLLETELSKEQLDCAWSLKTSGDSLLLIINDILDFSKIEAGKTKIQEIDFDFNHSMEKLNELIFLSTDKIKLIFDINNNIPDKLVGDPEILNNIFTNLLKNAVEFSNADEIIIRVSLKNETASDVRLFFEVFNKGAFIKQTEQETDVLAVEKDRDKDLGLIIAKKLVELMGGKFGIEKAEDTCTSSWFTINLKKQYDSAKYLTNRIKDYLPEEKKKPEINYKILLVEDNKINQKVAVAMLKNMGHHVSIANNGAEAVEVFEKDSYDFILMNGQMPVLGGVEATIQIRKKEKKGKRTPIIALTANVMKGDRERFLEAGVDGFVAKPIKKELLINVINNCIEKNKL